VRLLRITAEKHYASDVVTGAAVGAVIGWMVPGLLDRGTSDGTGSLTIRPVTGRGRTGAVAVWKW
jgi:membrane-associated phospholipid phosphatase